MGLPCRNESRPTGVGHDLPPHEALCGGEGQDAGLAVAGQIRGADAAGCIPNLKRVAGRARRLVRQRYRGRAADFAAVDRVTHAEQEAWSARGLGHKAASVSEGIEDTFDRKIIAVKKGAGPGEGCQIAAIVCGGLVQVRASDGGEALPVAEFRLIPL